MYTAELCQSYIEKWRRQHWERPLNTVEINVYSAQRRESRKNQMSLLVFYNALLSTLGKHLGIIILAVAPRCHLVCENELSLLAGKNLLAVGIRLEKRRKKVAVG